LQAYFSKLFMAEMVGYQKPDRRFFEYAIKSVHAHKNECLMIGDDPEAISGEPITPESTRSFITRGINLHHQTYLGDRRHIFTQEVPVTAMKKNLQLPRSLPDELKV